MKSQKKIIVFDTTLRDGEQAPGFHMTPAGKMRIARRLARLRVDVIEAGFPASSAADARAVAAIARTVGRAPGAPEICALARCLDADVDAAVAAVRGANRPRVHVFIATSRIHMAKKLRMEPAQVLDRIRASVRRAARAGVHVQFSAEDASRSDISFLAEAVRTAIQAGAGTINIPDTVGYAVPHEHAARIRALARRVPETRRVVMSVHCHDDLGMAVANTFESVRAGARQVECAMNGIGERAGNCATEEIVMALRVRGAAEGFWTGVDRRQIHQASRAVAAVIRTAVPPNKAIVGANAFAHASGIHQDGVVKHRETYEIMRAEDVGAPASRLILTSRSGRRAVEHRLNALGARVSGAALERVFANFKAAADRVAVVGDRALLRLARP
jgi:2-isopropylmalate synthase